MPKKQKSGLYRTKIKIGVDAQGRDINKWVSGRTMAELEKALEESKAIHDRPVLLDMKVLPKSMTEGYGSWWRVGSVAVGGTEANRAAWRGHLEHVKDARKY